MHTIHLPQPLEQQLTELAIQHNLPLDLFILQSLQNIVEQQDPDDTSKAEILAGLQRALADAKAGRVSPVKQLWIEKFQANSDSTEN